MTQRFNVEIVLTIRDAETGAPFAESTQSWADMSMKSVVGVERVMHNAQGALLDWAEKDAE